MDERNVLVLEHAPHENSGLVGRALRAKGVGLEHVRVHAGDAVPREPGNAVGVLVMGGPMGVYEAARFPHLRHEMGLIEEALRRGLPVLGICLGSQLLAHVLGADVRKGNHKEIGWHKVTLTEDGLLDELFKGLESSFMAFHWHGDVFDVPRAASSLLRSDNTGCQAFRHGTSAYGVLCHMEVTTEIVEGMLRAFPDEVIEAGLTEEAIRQGASEHLPPLSERGNQVFAGWADRVTAYRDGIS